MDGPQVEIGPYKQRHFTEFLSVYVFYECSPIDFYISHMKLLQLNLQYYDVNVTSQ